MVHAQYVRPDAERPRRIRDLMPCYSSVDATTRALGFSWHPTSGQRNLPEISGEVRGNRTPSVASGSDSSSVSTAGTLSRSRSDTCVRGGNVQPGKYASLDT